MLLLGEHDASNCVCTASGAIAMDEGGAHLGIAFRGFELPGHTCQKACQDELALDADDGVVRAGHADVGLEGGAVVEEALVRGRDVGMGAEDGGDATVEVPAEGDLFRGGLGVDVEEDDFGSGLAADLGEKLVGLAEGIVAGGHENAALEVDDGVRLSRGEFALVEAETGRAGGVVGGAEDASAAVVGVRGHGHVVEDLALVPDVVAGGDDMGAEVEELFGKGWGDAEAAGGVLAVDDEEVDGVRFEDVGEVFADDMTTGGAEDVSDEEDVHFRRVARGFGTGFSQARTLVVACLTWHRVGGFS